MADKYDRDGIEIRRSRDGSGFGIYELFADEYCRAGYWPIPVAGKILIVTDATGYEGTVTLKKVQGWKRTHRTSDIALRADGWLGIDVDHRGKKRGADQLLELEAKLGPLPPTFSITSRGPESPSRTYLFKVENEVPRRSKAAKDIEIVHKFHRYSVTFPTIHPDTGERYEWYSPELEQLRTWLPSPEELPLLPPAWDEYLTSRHKESKDSKQSKVRRASSSFSGLVSEWEEWLGTEDPTPPVNDLIRRITEEPHIGHEELLHYIFEVHELRALCYERGVGYAYQHLAKKYFAETNNANPHKELEDIIRWVVQDDWAPLPVTSPPLSELYARLLLPLEGKGGTA